jgi:hypothetical protein
VVTDRKKQEAGELHSKKVYDFELLTIYYFGDQLTEDGIGGICSTIEGGGK